MSPHKQFTSRGHQVPGVKGRTRGLGRVTWVLGWRGTRHLRGRGEDSNFDKIFCCGVQCVVQRLTAIVSQVFMSFHFCWCTLPNEEWVVTMSSAGFGPWIQPPPPQKDTGNLKLNQPELYAKYSPTTAAQSVIRKMLGVSFKTAGFACLHHKTLNSVSLSSGC